MGARGPALVIGYGSELRGDDALGPLAADAVASWALPGVEAVALHQLTPELAEPIAAARLAIFVDAAAGVDPGQPPRVSLLAPGGPAPAGHASSPEGLLALADLLFGARPPAFLVAIPAADFTLGAELSPAARRGLAAALGRIRELLGEPPAPHPDEPPAA